MRKSGVQSPSAEMRRAIERDGVPPGVDGATLVVAELRGTYSGRKVRHVRVFDPSRAAARGVGVRAYADLDAHPDLVLWTGRVEQDGMVAITRQAAPGAPEVGARRAADRAAHGDDEHLVFRSDDR